MARPRLHSPDQPLPVRLFLGLYELLASLRLAVAVIFASAVVLGWATFVESRYGTQAVRFGIYGTWWFAALMALLGVNVLCAALIRFPWKKHQTGFVMTHAGILVLLAGCLLTRLGGIDAQLPVFEGGTGHLAFEDTQHFELNVYGQSAATARTPTGGSNADGTGEQADANGRERPAQTIEVPFASGPFNWDDYDERFWFPWRLAHRERGILYDQDGVRLEVLDYYSDSKLEPAAPLKLRVRGPSGSWDSVTLEVKGAPQSGSPHGGLGSASRGKLPGDVWAVFWPARCRAETQAFLHSRPEGALGRGGQIVLYAGDAVHRFCVDELKPQQPVTLGSSGMEMELVEIDDRLPRVTLRIHPRGGPPRAITLFADLAEFNEHDEEHGVFGTYWFDWAEMPEEATIEGLDPRQMAALRKPRIDIIQGSDGNLYYRTWSSPQLGAVAPLPTDGTKIVAFGETGRPLALYVEQFVPHDRPGFLIEPAPYVSSGDKRFKLQQARVRLAVDGNAEEFWLLGRMRQPKLGPPRENQRKVVHGKGRRVAVTLPKDAIDVGFQVYLHRFERKLDPGSSQASYYASLVDLLDREDEEKRLETEVLITLNEPVNFTDQRTGRSYRVYQESFAGPFKPGEPMFEENVEPANPRDELFLSWLTVNYDPGRGLKYFGSLLVVAGIATVFYMRAYFFRRRPSAKTGPESRG